MMITLTQSGGWANVSMRASLDSETLQSSDARLVLELLDQPPPGLLRSVGLPPVADGMQYELEIDTNAGPRVLRFTDSSKPLGVQRLLEVMRPLFRPVPYRRPGHHPLG